MTTPSRGFPELSENYLLGFVRILAQTLTVVKLQDWKLTP